MSAVQFDEPARYPRWVGWTPFVLILIAALGLAASVILGSDNWLPDSPRGWLLVGVAVLGLVAWFAIEAVDLSWLPGGRDQVRLTTEALHVGDATFRLDELTGDVTWDPETPERLELGLTRGGTLPVETRRPDELRAALRRVVGPAAG